MIVMGDREVEEKTVSLRAYGSRDSQTMSQDEVKKLFTELNQERVPKALR